MGCYSVLFKAKFQQSIDKSTNLEVDLFIQCPDLLIGPQLLQNRKLKNAVLLISRVKIRDLFVLIFCVFQLSVKVIQSSKS